MPASSAVCASSICSLTGMVRPVGLSGEVMTIPAILRPSRAANSAQARMRFRRVAPAFFGLTRREQ